jgi:hypothetical protein
MMQQPISERTQGFAAASFPPCFLDPSLSHFLPRFFPLLLIWRSLRVPHFPFFLQR